MKAPYMVHGITTQAVKFNINVITRAIIKINKLALLGKMGIIILSILAKISMIYNLILLV